MPLITFEGIEGSGKSTQLRRLAGRLPAGVRQEREPGSTPLGRELRRLLVEPGEFLIDPAAELLLVEADRRQHVREVLRPSLARGETILCDRFNDATFAYQVGGRGLPRRIVETLDAWVTDGLRPDLTILFDCPAGVGLARALRRDGDAGGRFEREPLDFHDRVRAEYLARADADPSRIRILDASRGEDEIARDVFEIVSALLNL